MFKGTEYFRFFHDSGELKIEEAVIGVRGLRISEVRSTGHEVALVENELATLLMPRSGRIEAVVGSTVFTADATDMLAFRPNARRTHVGAASSGIFSAGVLIAPFSLLEAAAEGALDNKKDLPDCARSSKGLNALTADYLDFVLRSESDVGPLFRSERAAQAVEAILLDFAVSSLFGGREPIRPASFERVRKAVTLMRERFEEPLSMLDLAREVGVGLRSLELAFVRACGLSPREVLVSIRLDEARARLNTPGEARSVTEVALACGFTHLGRFSVTYRRRFGERPSDTERNSGRDAAARTLSHIG